MAVYRIWICDPLYEVRKTGNQAKVAKKLNEWFDPIARAATPPFDGAQCVFPQYIVTPSNGLKPHELLIYVVSAFSTVVKKMPGSSRVAFPNPATTRHLGVTVIGNPTGSEIWMKMNSVDAIASLIFHEAMHNKLQVGNALHSRFNRCQLSCASIHWPTSPSPAESAAMSAALRNRVPQWTEGQRILRRARLARKAGDPRWEVEIDGSV